MKIANKARPHAEARRERVDAMSAKMTGADDRLFLASHGWIALGDGYWRKDGGEFPQHFALWLQRQGANIKVAAGRGAMMSRQVDFLNERARAIAECGRPNVEPLTDAQAEAEVELLLTAAVRGASALRNIRRNEDLDEEAYRLEEAVRRFRAAKGNP